MGLAVAATGDESAIVTMRGSCSRGAARSNPWSAGARFQRTPHDRRSRRDHAPHAGLDQSSRAPGAARTRRSWPPSVLICHPYRACRATGCVIRPTSTRGAPRPRADIRRTPSATPRTAIAPAMLAPKAAAGSPSELRPTTRNSPYQLASPALILRRRYGLGASPARRSCGRHPSRRACGETARQVGASTVSKGIFTFDVASTGLAAPTALAGFVLDPAARSAMQGPAGDGSGDAVAAIIRLGMRLGTSIDFGTCGAAGTHSRAGDQRVPQLDASSTIVAAGGDRETPPVAPWEAHWHRAPSRSTAGAARVACAVSDVEPRL